MSIVLFPILVTPVDQNHL